MTAPPERPTPLDRGEGLAADPHRLRALLEEMANRCRVDMALWDAFSNEVLRAADALDALAVSRLPVEGSKVLGNPQAVMLNMMRGGIAKPTLIGLSRLYTADELHEAAKIVEAQSDHATTTEEGR